ncbi:uncharacterized protein LOC111300069 isoform X2 [Durio zibethinus]|uniref:Uncharacterized protein LOC111300069 isoform X2 n=1 Tax=Durio zibethinus TaxID=66656 RepID=A0A6P5ZFY4_DURZI|nr:uncharacterized protein LOC111300069 isoform X2 [Durio zibethinus]
MQQPGWLKIEAIGTTWICFSDAKILDSGNGKEWLETQRFSPSRGNGGYYGHLVKYIGKDCVTATLADLIGTTGKRKKKLKMEKWRATSNLRRSLKSVLNRRLSPGSDFTYFNEKRSFPARFNPIRDQRSLREANAIQYRYFSSVSTLVQRNPSFSTLNSDDISYFKRLLGEKNVIQDEDRLETANTDWMHKYKGSSKLLLQPRSTEEVSQILKYCNSRCLAVVPQGGNTGLVGGSVPVFDEVQKEAVKLVEMFQLMLVVCVLYVMVHFTGMYLYKRTEGGSANQKGKMKKSLLSYAYIC